ncbi:MAG: xanthine dehydrogenase family protein subunit M [Chloroflexota bacterium]|nr:xanthine dehydrogenase family protein subunit M [Chloroflexota bacterium]
MRPFSYIRPSTISEAITLLGARPDGDDVREDDRPRLLAGGTDLLTLMKDDIAVPSQLIDIKRLPELDNTISPSPEGTRIGALTSLAQIVDDPVIRDMYPALSEAAGLAATPQLRNMATIGGNLLQRPRCWYYRNDLVSCWLKGGEDCPARDGENQHHALFGESPCVAVHPSDLATALVTLEASIRIQGSEGERTLPLEAFFSQPTEARRRENVVQQSDVITAIIVPNPAPTAQSTYLKAMDRKVWAFAQVGVGAMLVIEEQRITEARLVLGAVAPTPWRATAAEGLLTGATPGRELFERVAGVALEGAAPLSHNGYKVPLAKALVIRALMAASTPTDMSA